MSKKFLFGAIMIVAIFVSAAVFVHAQKPNTATVNTAHVQSLSQVVVSIDAKGKALIRGTVDSVSANLIKVKSWGGVWTVNMASSTKVVPHIGSEKGDLLSVAVGDFVGVQGTASQDIGMTIEATLIRDWTGKKAVTEEQKQNLASVKETEKTSKETGIGKIFVGIVSALGTNTLTLTPENQPAYTVQFSSSVKILNRLWLKLPFAKIQVNDHLRIFGTASGTDMTADVVRDISLPK